MIPTTTSSHTALYAGKKESFGSGVSWAAVAAGAFAATALGLALIVLGSGLGLSVISPWSSGNAAATLGKAALAWLIVAQVISSALGGYLAGRLRARWVYTHNDEVFFRDTAHGFLVWAVCLVVTAGLLSSVATMLAGGVSHAAMAVANRPDSGPRSGGLTELNDYYVDGLFRAGKPGTVPAIDPAVRGEVGRIIAIDMRRGEVSENDSAYLAKVVAARAGISEADARMRVDATVTEIQQAEANAKQAADTARKAAAHLAIWTFLALLVGAFCASVAAAIGGLQRDNVVLVD